MTRTTSAGKNINPGEVAPIEGLRALPLASPPVRFGCQSLFPSRQLENAPAASAESARGSHEDLSTVSCRTMLPLMSCSAAHRYEPCRIDEVLLDLAPSVYGR